MNFLPLSSIAHNPDAIARRWKRVARLCGASFEKAVDFNGEPVWCFRSRCLNPGAADVVYLSAGIHGDEPAAVLGLLLWAEQQVRFLRERPVLIFPLLNPWGLRENSRRCAGGTDLNRIWHKSRHPLVHTVRRALYGLEFACALTLHEDYDAEGFYLYEPTRKSRSKSGEKLVLQLAERGFVVDSRKTIEGNRPTLPGLIRRRKFSGDILRTLPEALFLFLHPAFSSARVFTFETPSEKDLEFRTEAQRLFVHLALQDLSSR